VVVAVGLWVIGMVLSRIWPSTEVLENRDRKHFPFGI